MRLLRLIFLAAGLAGAVACQQQRAAKVPVDADELASAAKADWFGSKVQEVGTIYAGQSQTVVYANPPLYRSLRYQSPAGGAPFTVSVTAPGQSPENADAVAWLLDEKHAVVAENDDADPSTADSLISMSWLPEGTYHIVIREYGKRAAMFQVTVGSGIEEDAGVADAGVPQTHDGGVADAWGWPQPDAWVWPQPDAGVWPDAHVVDGAVPDGHVVDGAVPDGHVVDGAVPDGRVVDGAVPDGNVADGGIPDGNSADGWGW